MRGTGRTEYVEIPEGTAGLQSLELPEDIVDLAQRCLQCDPDSRLSAREFLCHPFFDQSFVRECEAELSDQLLLEVSQRERYARIWQKTTLEGNTAPTANTTHFLPAIKQGNGETPGLPATLKPRKGKKSGKTVSEKHTSKELTVGVKSISLQLDQSLSRPSPLLRTSVKIRSLVRLQKPWKSSAQQGAVIPLPLAVKESEPHTKKRRFAYAGFAAVSRSFVAPR